MAFLVDDLMLLPVNLVVWLGQELKKVAESETFDEGSVKGELLDLQMRLELEEINQAEYLEKEAALLERLGWIREHKEETHEEE